MYLSTQQLQEYLKQFSYKEGWTVEIYGGDFEENHITIKAMLEDSANPKQPFRYDAHSCLPPFRELWQFDDWISWRFRRIEIHESMEFLKKNGRPLYDPHSTDRDKLEFFNM